MPLSSSSLFDGNGDSTVFYTHPNFVGESSATRSEPVDQAREAALSAEVPELHDQFGAVLSEVISL